MNSGHGIPFLDLVTPHKEYEEEFVGVFRAALRSAGFIGGPMVEGFEKEFAEFCGAKYCVGLASGTDALRFAFMAAGIQPGETIVTVPNTFIATTASMTQAGARIAFVDVDEKTYTMSPDRLREYLEKKCHKDAKTGRTVDNKTGSTIAAVVPVHLYGQMADMDPIMELAEEHKLIVIEDACQAHGAEYFSKKKNQWLKAGSIGKVATFSFYPGKNLGACGEAGAATTNDEQIAKRMKMIRDHGQSKKYYHDMEGYNGRLDSIQAGLLSVKLRHLAEWNEKRRKVAMQYDELFSSVPGITRPYCPDWAKPVYHLYVVRVRDREGFQKYLAEKGIGTGIHYPVPLHMQKAYAGFGYKQGDFPVTDRVSAEIVSLPMFPQLTSNQIKQVVHEVSRFLQSELVAEKVGANRG